MRTDVPRGTLFYEQNHACLIVICDICNSVDKYTSTIAWTVTTYHVLWKYENNIFLVTAQIRSKLPISLSSKDSDIGTC